MFGLAPWLLETAQALEASFHVVEYANIASSAFSSQRFILCLKVILTRNKGILHLTTNDFAAVKWLHHLSSNPSA